MGNKIPLDLVSPARHHRIEDKALLFVMNKYNPDMKRNPNRDSEYLK